MEKILETIRAALNADRDAIKFVRDNMELATVALAARVLYSCLGMAYVSGCGAAGTAGKKLVHTLNCVERPAAFIEPSEAAYGGMGAVGSGDVVVLISGDGETGEILDMLCACKNKGAFIIGVTQNGQSALAAECDLFLQIMVEREADQLGILATSSIIAMNAVFDAIAVCIMEEKGFTKDKFTTLESAMM